jgi:isoquinoline 1-oxidoreductase alpha subunit
MATIDLHINGRSQTVTVEEDMPLLWVLRDILSLTGTKYSCGMGHCGSCTVLIEGQPTRSCITPASTVAGKAILTIEGLSEHGEHPVQKAWEAEQVTQCGYCQPGQIMNAIALLEKTPQPTDDNINQAMAGVLCRCGTYNRIRKAIHRVAEGV